MFLADKEKLEALFERFSPQKRRSLKGMLRAEPFAVDAAAKHVGYRYVAVPAACECCVVEFRLVKA